jgi:DNA-directed RNA polymerase specialized sigma24 family protein
MAAPSPDPTNARQANAWPSDIVIVPQANNQANNRAFGRAHVPISVKVMFLCRGRKDFSHEDVLNSVIVLILQYSDLDKFDPSRANFKTFISRVVKSRFIDLLRSENRAKSVIAKSINDLNGEEYEEILNIESEAEGYLKS